MSMKMAVICLVALILSGCAEYLQEVASRPAYQARWLATPGMTQQYPQNTSVNVCMGEANQARQQAYYAYLASSQNTSTAPTNHQLGSTLAAGIAARNAQTAANNAAANSYQIRLNACMNRSGYSLQNVCVKNCWEPLTPLKRDRDRDRSESWKRIYCKDQSIPPIISAHEAEYCPKGSSPY